MRRLWERVESAVAPPRADAEAFAQRDTIPLTDDGVVKGLQPINGAEGGHIQPQVKKELDEVSS